jgi:hypothetical protein
MIKEIGLPFIAGSRAGAVCHQGEGWLHVFLLDPTTAATAATTSALLVLLLMLLLLLLV